jgi:hypothetical protein
MKYPFRFFRGELTKGFYLKHLVMFLNGAIEDILDELVYHATVQWKLNELKPNESAIREDDVFGIGKIAGLFAGWSVVDTTLGSLRFTESHKVNGRERSERGLFDMDYESFQFVRTENDFYPDDIVNDASVIRRMSVTENGAEPIGWVKEGVRLYSQEGEIIWANILHEKPTEGAYVPFYGEKYLHTEQWIKKLLPLPVDIYKMLFECYQRISYNGLSLSEYLNATTLLCENYVCDIEVIPHESRQHYIVYYSLNPDAVMINRERRFYTWQGFTKAKYPMFVLKDRINIIQE